MKCPHCLVEFFAAETYFRMGADRNKYWTIGKLHCPSCMRFIFKIYNHGPGFLDNGRPSDILKELVAYPSSSKRPPCPQEVPETIAADYVESCKVLVDSPKASAALSRRCLQNLLRDAAGVSSHNLADEIQQVLDSNTLPSYLAESIDAIRNIGNFAAHPIKSEHSGAIIDVEESEAEWNLDVLESLFDFYYVQPAILRAKRDAFNSKLSEAGKPPMK